MVQVALYQTKNESCGGLENRLPTVEISTTVIIRSGTLIKLNEDEDDKIPSSITYKILRRNDLRGHLRTVFRLGSFKVKFMALHQRNWKQLTNCAKGRREASSTRAKRIFRLHKF